MELNSFNPDSIPEKSRLSPRIGELLLVTTTILWGSTFIITNTLTQVIPPMFYMGVRYFIGLLGFLPFLPKMKKLTKHQWKIAIIAGTLCWISFATQTYGIKMTTATKSAFLTGLNVIMVPIFYGFLFKKKIPSMIWISSVLAVIGVSVFSFGQFNKFEFGDALILICDVFYAFYIIYLDKNLKKVDILSFSAVIVLVIGVNSFIMSFLVEDYSVILNFSNGEIYNWKNLLI